MVEEDVETELPGVLLYAKCHTAYAPEGNTGTLLELVEGDIVAVVQEKPATGWYSGLLLSGNDSKPRWFPKNYVREVKLKPSKCKDGAVTASEIARMGGFAGGEEVHPGASMSETIDVPVADGRVSPSDVNLSDMAATLAVAKAAKRGSTPPRVRTPERSAGRISFASTKSGKAQQLSPPKFARNADLAEAAEDVHLPTLTPLARSLATNVAQARARSNPAPANDGQSPVSPVSPEV